jgi:hypothetical protein
VVHAGLGKNAGVNEEDVGHRQEGGETGEDLGAQRSVVRLELEQLLQHGQSSCFPVGPAVGIVCLSGQFVR